MRTRGPHHAIGLYAHLTWHTKHREATIRGPHLSMLGDAIGAAAERTKVRVHALAMLTDHVHIVASYSPDATLSAFVREAKSESARRAGIRWCRGFYANSIGSNQVAAAKRYVAAQYARHPDKIPARVG